jgi:hypothetical protein
VLRAAIEAHAVRLLAAVAPKRPRPVAGGAAAIPEQEEIVELIMAKGPPIARAIFGWSSIYDAEDALQESVLTLLDRVTRLYDPSRGLTWEKYTLMSLRMCLKDQRRRAAKRADRFAGRVGVEDVPERFESDSIDRIDAELDAREDVRVYDEFVRNGPFKPSERAAYFARRRGLPPGSRAERRAYWGALERLRAEFVVKRRAA